MQKPSKILADIETEFGDCVSAGYGCRRRFEAALERAFEAGREYERSPRENAEAAAFARASQTEWQCDECANVNEKIATVCGDCNTPRPRF
jgi:hypothetical protein